MTIRSFARVLAGLVVFGGAVSVSENAAAQSQRGLDARAKAVIEHWTPERREAAIPRDLFIDPRGLAYIQGHHGLAPYGHNIAAQAGPAGDGTPPSVTNMSPAAGAVIGAAATFSASVSDTSGIRSVKFKVRKGTARYQSFSANNTSGSTWSLNLSGFTDGSWDWLVEAKDGSGLTRTTPAVAFTVNTSTGGGGGGGNGSVANAEWADVGKVNLAAGRIFFEMPSNGPSWAGYVCSGTVVADGTSGRSIILTAAHCVYDDVNKVFARNVLFIPNQDDTSVAGTDTNCANDPIGCWTPSFGVVDNDWTTRTFPNNVMWDYAFYVVNDSGAYQRGLAEVSAQLDGAVPPLSIQFTSPSVGGLAHAIGYSYSEDPKLMYCADPLGNMDAANWWLPNCGLSGGSSGGPWLQPVSGGDGPIISVNSWGYTNQPGMAGPKFTGTTSCVFSNAKTGSAQASTPRGLIATCN